MLQLARRIIEKLTNRYEAARQYSQNRTRYVGALQAPRLDLDKCTREELLRLIIGLEQNSSIVQRLADIFECYTVGANLQIVPASSSPEWNAMAKTWHGEWEQFPDIASRQNFGTFIGLAARCWFVQGESFIAFVNGGEMNSRAPFPRLQMIESRLCYTPDDMRKMEGESIIDGISIDQRGRPSNYWFASESKDKVVHSSVPSDQIVHIFEPSRPGQYRGVTFFHSVINEIRDLRDLMHFEMIASKDWAEKSGVLTTQTGEISAANLIRSRVSVTNQAATAATVDNTEARAEYVQDAIGGRTIALRPNEKFEQLRGERPSPDVRAHWRELKQCVADGVGIPFHFAFPESIQGTVARMVADIASVFFQQRHAVIADAVRRIYQRNIKWAMANVPAMRNAPADWYKVNIIPPRAANADIGYTSSATIAELAAGLTNFAKIYGSRGMDWRDEMTQLNSELEFADSIGLTEKLARINAASKAMADPATEQPTQDTNGSLG